MATNGKVLRKDRNKRKRRAAWPWYARYLWLRQRSQRFNRINAAKPKKIKAKTGILPVALPTVNRKVSVFKSKPTPAPRKPYLRKQKGYTVYTNPYTRTRTDTRRLYHYRASPRPITQQLDSTAYTYVYSRSKTGNYKPNWRAVIKAAGNATTAFSAWMQETENNPCDIRFYFDQRINQFNPWVSSYTADNYVNYVDGSAIGTHAIPGVAQKAQDRAATELVKKIHSARHQLQGGVILGEIDKTARLLIGTAKDLKQGVFKYLSKAVGIRKGRGSNSSKRRAIANSYLEATFGWQPLIHDCKDFAKTLGRLTTEVDRTYLRAFAEWEEQSSYGSIDNAPGVGGQSCRIDTIVTTYCRVVYRGFLQGIPYEAGKPPLERIISMSGFDLRSFVPTMWELVPYSFIVDYFSNIGDCLLSWTIDTDCVKALWRTQVMETVRETRTVPSYDKSLQQLKANLGTNGRNYSGWKKDGLHTVLYRTVSRDAAAVPLLVPKLKGLDLPWRQFANMGALISSKSR